MSFYLDASVMLPILVRQSSSAVVDALMATVQQQLWVSDFAAAELASALSRLVRMALLTEADASARLRDFDAWRAAMSSPVDITASDARLAYIMCGGSIWTSECRTPCTFRSPDVSMQP